MTVPPLFGWEQLLAVLVLVVLVAVAALVLLASGRATDERTEWRAWLDSRSEWREDVAGASGDGRSDVAGTAADRL